jgi:hypothetical protein
MAVRRQPIIQLRMEDVAEELRLREEAELAADTAEEAFYNGKARLRRIGETINALSETRADRPAERDHVLQQLAARDPEGATQLRELLLRAGAGAAAGDRDELLRAVAAADVAQHASAEDAKGAHEAALASLAAHARAIGGGLLAGKSASP